MASIEKRISKSGERTCHITARPGYGLDGKKVRRRTTYKPNANMSDKQADKEVLVSYHAAEKATLPRIRQKDVNCLQPMQICDILDALETGR